MSELLISRGEFLLLHRVLGLEVLVVLQELKERVEFDVSSAFFQDLGDFDLGNEITICLEESSVVEQGNKSLEFSHEDH